MANNHGLLRLYREKHGISCGEFARKLGVAEPTMRSLENGTRPITPERAKKIEEVTGGELTRPQLLPDIFGPHSAPRSRAAA
jgi:DNA-binding transcriptional regulator YdaS (Cro superfamily)